jgi:small-conductance mechanosensitive channel
MSEPTLLETIGVNLAAFFTTLLQSVFGPSLAEPVLGQATWGDLLASVILIVIILVLAIILRALLNWLEHRNRREEPHGGWRRQSVIAVGKPLIALLWLHGIYAALLPVLDKTQSSEEAAFHAAIERLLDVGVFATVIWLFYRFTHVLNLQLISWTKRSKTKADDLLIPAVMRTLRVALPILAVILALPILGLPADYDYVVSKLSSLALIAVVAWVLFQFVRTGESFLLATHDTKVTDNLEARKIHTQVKVLSKTIYFIITIFTIASMLMVFEEVRRFGTNILASAGVVGIILGFAAQRTIANLFAGFQLAMAQPIRLDDVLVVEGEWGRVEEITLTYVVVRIWDQRRLILPISYFIEKPFQNWTRTSSEIMGSVFFYADYTVPIEAIRAEAKRLIENHPNWDKKFWNVQITEATDRALQIRVLMTTADSGKGWNMRCDVREGLISFIQKNYPGSLPKVRAELEGSERCNPVLEGVK